MTKKDHPFYHALNGQCDFLKLDLEHLLHPYQIEESVRVTWTEDHLNRGAVILEINLPTPVSLPEAEGILVLNRHQGVIEKHLIPLHFGGECTFIDFFSLSEHCVQLQYRIEEFENSMKQMTHVHRSPSPRVWLADFSCKLHFITTEMDYYIEDLGIPNPYKMRPSKQIWEAIRINESVYKVQHFQFPEGGNTEPLLEMLKVQIALAPNKVATDTLFEKWQDLQRFYSDDRNWILSWGLRKGPFMLGRQHLEIRVLI